MIAALLATVLLHWTAPLDSTGWSGPLSPAVRPVSGYEVQYQMPSGAWTPTALVHPLPPSDPGAPDSGSVDLPTGWFSVRLRALDANGNRAPWSNRPIYATALRDTFYALMRPWGPQAWARGPTLKFDVRDTLPAWVEHQETVQSNVPAWIKARYGCWWRGARQPCAP